MNRFATIGPTLTLSAAFAVCDTAEPPAAVSIAVAKAEAARSANVAEERLEGAKEVARQRQAMAAQRRGLAEAAAIWNFEVALSRAEASRGFRQAKRSIVAVVVSEVHRLV